MERASVANPSHPAQEAWKGIPAQVLWSEGYNPPRASFIHFAIAALIALFVVIGMALR